ncbi:hypothetical protein [Altericista sp. CCNU0014]|uniref:hypothetical protein n=1 Tax=Altericista sp. CCNU0014 TaxID=3082949 RepID=UPI003850FF86
MSPTPGYQSRLFKTARSQVRQLKDNVQLRWRQLKVATAWGVQAGLYPFYVLFQAGRWGGQVLQQAAARGKQALLFLVRDGESVSTDRPIQNVLDAIEQIALPTVGNHPSPEIRLAIRPIPKPKSPLAVLRKKLRSLWQPWRRTGQPTAAISDLSVTASVSLQSAEQSDIVARSVAIRGIASSLAHRQLVLVTSENQLLDVLTADQQQQLHQRIIWEIAQALYIRRQFSRPRAIPGWKTWQALPIKVRPQYSFPVRAIYHLMAWVQQQPIAQIGILPGSQPLSLPTSALGSPRQWQAALQPSWLRVMRAFGAQKSSLALTSKTPSLPIPKTLQQKLRGYRTALVAIIGAIALLPFTLALPEPANAATAPALPAPLPSPLMVERLIDPSRSRRRWQAEAKLSEQSGRLSQGKVRISPQKTAATLSTQGVEGTIADWTERFSQTTPAGDPSAIEVNAVFMGYDRHPLEVLLLWVDRAIAWIETQFVKIRDGLALKLQNWLRHYR